MRDRITISVSEGLKARMDAVTVPVNWSAVACQAFEVKLGEIAQQKKEKVMEDVIQRLKASKLKGEAKVRQDGLAAGKRWATHEAEACDLERIERAAGDEESWDTTFTLDCYRSHHSLAYHVSVLISGDENGYLTEDDASAFWEGAGATAEEMQDPLYLEAFCDGALEVWEQVKKHL